MSPQDYHVSENFYTYEELQKFTNNFTNLSISKLLSFLIYKAENKIVFVNRGELINLIDLLEDATQFFNELKAMLNKRGVRTIENNTIIIKEWRAKIREIPFVSKEG